jgi:aspartate--ammonia ligase
MQRVAEQIGLTMEYTMKATETGGSSYQPLLDLRQTERAIRVIKEFFQTNLAAELNLLRVSAPLFVQAGTGINDNLNGVEMPISFAVKGLNGRRAEIVQSLAKWKRMALADYGFAPGEGIYTDMNAIRPDEVLDDLHSIYVDQWDWERVMGPDERNLNFLRRIVERIYDVIVRTEHHVAEKYPVIKPVLPPKIHFVHTEDLERRYPDLSPREREDRICQELKAVFVIGIGAPLSNGRPHDGRAPDYDDWTTPTDLGPGLNGDIFVWNPVIDRAFELSSMGIRVDAQALRRQLTMTKTEERTKLLFHRRLLAGELPQSIGGGIGESRLCMLYLRKVHVGEVQCSVWPDEMREELRRRNIVLL